MQIAIAPLYRRALAPAVLFAALLAPSAAGAADVTAGKAKYDMLCTSCHGAEGKGDGPAAIAAGKDNPPRDFSVGEFKFDTDGDGKAGTDVDLKNVIEHGAQKYGGSVLMAPWGGMLQGQDLDNLVAFIRSLKK